MPTGSTRLLRKHPTLLSGVTSTEWVARLHFELAFALSDPALAWTLQKDFFWAVSVMLEEAKESIMILDWCKFVRDESRGERTIDRAYPLLFSTDRAVSRALPSTTACAVPRVPTGSIAQEEGRGGSQDLVRPKTTAATSNLSFI